MAKMSKTLIKFWGVRGSLAAAGPQTVKYGGNTPSLEIRCGNTLIICDAGTGIRPLGLHYHNHTKPIKATLLMSHLHFDHVIGLPFFEPLYDKKNSVTIISPGFSGDKLKRALEKLISPPYFPLNILHVPCKLNFKSFPKPALKTGKIKIGTFPCNHPGIAYAFKFHLPSQAKAVYISDNEPCPQTDKKLIAWLKGSDLLIHDAQYTPRQYRSKNGWGHSPYTYPIILAQAAGIKKLILSHYDPATTDEELDHLKVKIYEYLKKEKIKVQVELAREGMSLSL
jgi:phosphoribosyl 1,2-cyclic phosphodiesterase